MAPMKKPATVKGEPWRSTVSVDAFAHRNGLSAEEVRNLLGTGRLPFVQVRGQIRIPKATTIREMPPVK